MISRSKAKIQQERVSACIRDHIQQRKEDFHIGKNVLNKEVLLNTAEPLHLTYINRVHEALMLSDSTLTLPFVNGCLTFAFNINIEQSSVDMSSTNMIDRNYIYLNGLLNMGFSARYTEAFNFAPPSPLRLIEAISLVQQSIDNGYPCLVWELINSEFGLIYGYDDDAQHFLGLDSKSISEIPYYLLGGRKTKSLFVLGIEKKSEIDPLSILLRTFKMIIRHARGKEATFGGYVNGLAAYETWMNIMQSRTIEPIGHAYTIAVLLQAREHAVRFLEEMTAKWSENASADQEITRLLTEATGHYKTVYGSFAKLHQQFPMPSGGEPNDPISSAQGIESLKQALQAEEAGVEILEQIVSRIEKDTKLHVLPFIDNPPRAYNL